jgi:CubicO group peptidase (beta-lactamase class C family)
MKKVFFAVLLALTSSLAPAASRWDDLERYLFNEERQTEAFIVSQNGRIIYEKYAGGFDAGTPHILWSVSKSLWQLVVGHAVYQGRIHLEDSVCEYVKEYKGTSRCELRVIDLLNFASGFDWQENYEATPTQSSVIDMLFRKGRSDMGSYVLRKRFAAAPNSRWMYSSGDTQLLGKILAHAYGAQDFSELPFRYFREHLGLTSLVAERDAAGTFGTASFFYLSARDMLSLGRQLLKSHANPRSDSMALPDHWLKNSWKVVEPFLRQPYDWFTTDVPGAHWWLNRATPEWNQPQPFPNAPQDVVLAQGHWGQLLAISPAEKLVVVRLSNQRQGTTPVDGLFGHLRRALNPNYKLLPTPKYELRFPQRNPDDSGLADTWKLLKIAQAYQSRLFCSCRFVMKQSEDYCRAYIADSRVPSWLVRIQSDAGKKVRGQLGFSTVHVSYGNAQEGCKFEN